jgi:DNA modification methylase
VFAKKSGTVFNEHCKSAVWRCATERYKDHPTPKPVKLMTRLIEASSNIGDTVFDPCMGSGAIGVAAKQCGRNFIGVEMNPEYFQMTQERIHNQTESVLSFM